MEGSEFAAQAIAALYADVRRTIKSGVEAEGVCHNLIAYGGVMTLAQDDPGRAAYICLRHACWRIPSSMPTR